MNERNSWNYPAKYRPGREELVCFYGESICVPLCKREGLMDAKTNRGGVRKYQGWNRLHP